MASIDVFSGDAFSLRALSAAVNASPYLPGRVGELGIFEESSINLNKVSVERLANAVGLVQTSSRGAPPVERDADLRTMYELSTTRIAVADKLYADTVQGIRAFGTDSEVQALQTEVNNRMALMAQQIAATIEWQRVTSLMGATKDADGTVLVDSSTVFGISDNGTATIDTNSLTAGDVREDCSGVIRTIEDALGGRPYTDLVGLVDATFFDGLVKNAEVRETYVYQEGAALRDRTARRSVFYGGIMWEEYRPLASGSPFATGQGIVVPRGAGIFKSIYGPADYNSTVNRPGLPLTANTFPDPDGARYQRLECQSNVLNVNIDPACVVNVDDGA